MKNNKMKLIALVAALLSAQVMADGIGPSGGGSSGGGGGGGVPSGPAGGDLTGTYPNPTVASTNGTAFGTAATKNTGTSGATIPLNNGANVESGFWNFNAGIGQSGFTTNSTSSFTGNQFYLAPIIGSATSASYTGSSFGIQYNSNFDTSGAVNAIYATAQDYGQGSSNQTSGIRATAQALANGGAYNSTASLYGGLFEADVIGTSTFNHAIGVKVNPPQVNGVTGYTSGLYIADQTNTGTSTITSQDAIHIEGHTGTDTAINAIAFGNGSSVPNSKIWSPSTSLLNIGTTTNPALSIDSSNASGSTGVRITQNPAGSGATLSTTGGSGNEALIFAPSGNGMVQVNSVSGLSSSVNGNTGAFSYNRSAVNISHATGGSSSTANLIRFSYVNSSDTGLTASTNAQDVVWDLSQARQHATGALTLQSDFNILSGNHSFVGASTLTDAATFMVNGEPTCGTNATCTNAEAILIPTKALTNTTNGSAISVAAPTGATNNYAISATGPITTSSIHEGTVGAAIASATTIAPANMVQHMTGTTAIATITPPSGMSSTVGGCITFIADGAWTTTTAGNIFATMTAVAGTPYSACYDGAKWYIK